jgi:hypothetical protein
MQVDAERAVRGYLWIAGAGLLLQGVISFALLPFTREPSRATDELLGSSYRHLAIHIVWGLVMLGALLRPLPARQLAWITLGFGVFYLAFGIAGYQEHDPFGIHMHRGENRFHLIVGSLALAIGACALWSMSRSRGTSIPIGAGTPEMQIGDKGSDREW